jgi:DNA-binding helix-hairpin-helix protein with protein kinase domain
VEVHDEWFLPWEAHEVVVHGEQHTRISDVWSLATLFWEIFSHGATPFAGVPPSGVRHNV